MALSCHVGADNQILGPLREQPVLLTSELSFQPLLFKKCLAVRKASWHHICKACALSLSFAPALAAVLREGERERINVSVCVCVSVSVYVYKYMCVDGIHMPISDYA